MHIKELNTVIEVIAKIRKAKYVTVVDELNKLKPDEGKINAHKFWKLKKKSYFQNSGILLQHLWINTATY